MRVIARVEGLSDLEEIVIFLHELVGFLMWLGQFDLAVRVNELIGKVETLKRREEKRKSIVERINHATELALGLPTVHV